MENLFDIVAEFVSGDWGEEAASPATPQPVFCIRGADIAPISSHDFSTIPPRYISSRSYSNNRLRIGDIIVEKSGGSPEQSTGRVIYVSQRLLSAKCNVVCSNFCTGIRIKPDWNPYFIYQYLLQVYRMGVFFNFEGKTSGIKNLQLEAALRSIPIPRIELPAQLRIAGVLGSLDEKIELNRHKVAELEVLLKTVYDYWFVQFDFPDANGRPYRSSGGKMAWNEELKREVPEGWGVGNLYSIARFENGLACQRFRPKDCEASLPVVKIREMHEGINTDTEKVSAAIPSKHRIADGDLLFSWSASLEAMIWCGGEAGLNQHIFKVLPNDGLCVEYVFEQLSACIANFARMAEARKTTMGHITSDHISQSRVILPDKTVLGAYATLVAPMFDECIVLRKEIHSLVEVRDSLLPLLMNGQVEVAG